MNPPIGRADREPMQRGRWGPPLARVQIPPLGRRLMHVHLVINGGSVMLSDPFPEHGSPHKEPQAFMLHLQVDGIDAAFQRAVDAGAHVTLPVQLKFWGDRYGQLRDPFGVAWSMGESQKKG